MRYVYAVYSSKERAERELENMFAEGLVSAGEKPRIYRRPEEWVITLADADCYGHDIYGDND
jgi:hypothetical protein